MRPRRWLFALAVVGVTVGAVALSACGDDDSGDAGSDEPHIAYLSPSAANTYVSETFDAMERIASERGADLTEFDAGFDVAKQQQQLQNLVASDDYDGVIIGAIDATLATDVTAAADAGLEVGVVGNILGTRVDTTEPQVEGVDLYAGSPPVSWGEGLGELTLQACEGKDPCRVVYFFAVKGSPNDNGFRQGFDETIAQNESIEIVAEGEAVAEDEALAAMQNIIQSTPEFDVVVGIDQAMQGVQLALEQAGKLDDVAIIGLGGSRAGIEAIAAGKWFGGRMTAPQTEGEVVMNGMLDLLEDDSLSGPSGVDPIADLPNNGLITKENVDEFEPQWKG